MDEREQQARSLWQFYGQERPAFAHAPKSGQESVWDYPRPPALVTDSRTVRVCRMHGEGEVIAHTRQAQRVLETASPPSFYLPPEALQVALQVTPGQTHCEWKGQAEYLVYAGVLVGWRYPEPTNERFSGLAGWISFYPNRVACFVDDERVRPQPGEFYGGWITDEIVGPVKGEAGSGGW